MNLHRAALPLLLTQLSIALVASQRSINGVASPGNFILGEKDLDLVLPSGFAVESLIVNSPVPVTIQRFSDNSFEGEEALTRNMAKVLVTSSCDTSETTVEPVIEEGDGSVTITIDGVAAGLNFIDPSSYSAEWKYKNQFCGDGFGGDGFGGGLPVPELPVLTICSSEADCAAEDEFCELKMGKCNDNAAVLQGYCNTKPDMCATIFSPVCGCDGKDYSNSCAASAAGVNVSREGKCDGVVLGSGDCEQGFCLGPDGKCAEQVLCFDEPCDVDNPCGADEKCVNNRCGDCTAVCQPRNEVVIPFEPVVLPAEGPVLNPGGSVIAGITPTVTEATTTMATTIAASSVGSTVAATTAATNASPSTVDDGKAPTSSPFQDIAPGSSSAFGPSSRSTSFCVATAFMAIALLSVIFPGSGANSNVWGLGKIAVAAMAASSIYSKAPTRTRGANVQKDNHHSKSSLANNDGRYLQDTCTYNVEILLDGCAHPAEINAPAARVLDVSIDDKTSVQDPTDECATDYTANLNFPTTNAIVLDLANDNIAPALDRWGFECNKPVIGRPFMDATGGSIQAMPLIPDGKLESCTSSLSWADSMVEDTVSPYTRNATTHEHFLMGEDWTQRALGEHSSVASFSAFSIALMTNQAPSNLVDAALKAGLDEVRHAKVSFDIASKLTGKEVGPGPLPPSSHEFGQDMTALALAVAREGCVDETLSAFSAALEVEHINAVLDDGLQDTLYSNIDHDTLTFIRDALVAIAMDESNHSALAWRTLNWACGVDTNACDFVHRDVFEESSLEKRFNQRADSRFGEKERVLGSMRREWHKISDAHRHAFSSPEEKKPDRYVCEESTVETGEDRSLLASVTENIIHQVLRS